MVVEQTDVEQGVKRCTASESSKTRLSNTRNTSQDKIRVSNTGSNARPRLRTAHKRVSV